MLAFFTSADRAWSSIRICGIALRFRRMSKRRALPTEEQHCRRAEVNCLFSDTQFTQFDVPVQARLEKSIGVLGDVASTW